MVCFLAPSSCWCVQLERPQSIGDIPEIINNIFFREKSQKIREIKFSLKNKSLLEIGANSENFMDDVLNTNNSMTT